MRSDESWTVSSKATTEPDLDAIKRLIRVATNEPPPDPYIGEFYFDRKADIMYIYVGEGNEPEWFNNNNEDVYCQRGWVEVFVNEEVLYAPDSNS